MIATYGSRGDVEPFVALGVGLQEAGHAVRLAAPVAYSPLVEAHGLELAPIEGDPAALARAFAEQAGLSWIRMVAAMARHVLPLAEAAFRTVESAVRDADLVVHSFLMTDAGHTLARMRAVPDVSAQFFPVFLSTSAFPAVAFPDLPLGGAYRRLSHLLNTWMFYYGGRLLYSRVRRAAPGLPTLAPWPFGKPYDAATPILFAYSPQVLPRPREWRSHAHVTGYWPLPVPPHWQPPSELVDFLEAGSPPIYFGPGSMRGEALPRLLRGVVASARACGERVLLDAPSELADDGLGRGDVFAAEGVPHAWLFPRMRFILHHGGAGTTGAALTSGVPCSAMPFSADQAFWARQLYRLGVGPACPPARALAQDRLQAILRDALSNDSYRQRAESLGEKLRQERGVASAIAVIQARLGIADPVRTV